MGILNFIKEDESNYQQGEHFFPTLEGAPADEINRYEELRKRYVAGKLGKPVEELDTTKFLII